MLLRHYHLFFQQNIDAKEATYQKQKNSTEEQKRINVALTMSPKILMERSL